ncbi:uncharacterized protein BKA55DRAFT_83657 [Fusarium redolens]|uniref:Ankyrin n=1 Tax=Fusarium redolens TaxID=48865 RepID=A0A9P9K087_FUSRE|nr:uncharacterized protein BKA55DRAFT_83657 [Fusarium redolens]KAH7244362.1 hypothetical protein BKA55DRAFT_83657 [Fusarium redolens]
MNSLGQSALHVAVLQPSRVAQLLAAGHQVDLNDKRGATPLMYAAAMNIPETVMMLVENGASLFGSGENSLTVLDRIARLGNWDLIWQVVDFAAATYPDLIPELFRKLLSSPYLATYEGCYAANDYGGRKGCINFWSRVISMLGSANFSFRDGTTLMHMTHNSRSARVLIQLGFTKFKQETGALLVHLASLHDLSLFQFAVANGGDAHLHSSWGWHILDNLLNDLEGCDWKGLPAVLKIIKFLLDKGVQVLSRDDCVCSCSAGGCMPGSNWLLNRSNLGLFAWLEILEKQRKVEEAKKVSLALLRRMSFDQAGLHHTCLTMCNFDLVSNVDNDRFWDISEQISIGELDREMEDLAAKTYSELKIEVMVRLRRIWKKKYMEQQPGPRRVPSSIRTTRNYRSKGFNELLEVIRASKHPKISEPFSSCWDYIVQKKLESDQVTLRYDLELAMVKLGVGLYQCGGEQFESWLPLLTQLTDVLLAEEPGELES